MKKEEIKEKENVEKVNSKEKKVSIFDIFMEFFLIGFISFGGGIAILKIYEHRFVDKKKWLTREELFDYYILSQITPGIIIIGTSSYIGYKLRGQKGVFASTLGVIASPILIILMIEMFLGQAISSEPMQVFFKGMTLVVCAIISTVSIDMIKNNIKNIIYGIMALAAFIAISVFNISVVYIVLISAILGYFIKTKNNKIDKDKTCKKNKENKEVDKEIKK